MPDERTDPAGRVPEPAHERLMELASILAAGVVRLLKRPAPPHMDAATEVSDAAASRLDCPGHGGRDRLSPAHKFGAGGAA
jgi:hypothetical protein